MHIVLIVICSLTLSFGAAVGVNLQKLSMNREKRRNEEHHEQGEQREQVQQNDDDDDDIREDKGNQNVDPSEYDNVEDEGWDESPVEMKTHRLSRTLEPLEPSEPDDLSLPEVPTEMEMEMEMQMQIDMQHHPNQPAIKPRPPYKQPLWCLGMAIITLDAIGDFVFIGLAPQTLLAPLGSLSLGWNVILAPIFNPEEVVTKRIVFATTVIYVGTILTVLFASDTSPTYELEDIVAFIRNETFLIYIASCVLFQFATFFHGHKYGYTVIHYCSLAGCFGGQCILFAKSSSELVKNVVINNEIDDWTNSILPYLFLLGMASCLLLQISFLNTGLENFDSLIVVPLYQSFWNIFAITGGLIFFQEHQNMSQLDDIMYAIGLIITLVGIRLFVLWRRRNPSNEESIEVEMLLASESQTNLRSSQFSELDNSYGSAALCTISRNINAPRKHLKI